MNKILCGIKVELDPNNSQVTLFRKSCGAARYAFNYALAKKKEAFDKKEKIPSNITLHKELNKIKGTPQLPWAYEVSKCAFQGGLRYCDRAFDNFFNRCKKKVKGKKGFPRFKSKRDSKQSFYLDGAISVSDSHIKLPRIGKVSLKEKGVLSGYTIKSVTISSIGCKWFVSCLVETDKKIAKLSNKTVGVDLGIKVLATCSDGTIYENPKALSKNIKRLRKAQRRFSKKKKGSKNKEKAREKLSKLHFRIANIRKDALHKMTTKIINENQVIILESIRASNMMKNRKLARSIADASFYEIKRQIEYKAKWNNREVIFADPFFASSKTCHCCGWKNDKLSLNDRVFKCDKCDNKICRDLNAAKNLEKLSSGSSSRIYASGDGSSSNASLISPSLNEEFNKKSRVYTLKR